MGALNKKVAIITGAASGMGAGTARRFIAEGAKVIIADVQDDKGRMFAKELGPNAIYQHCDVSKEQDVQDAVDLAVKTFGRLDCMFNNAGIGGNHTAIDKITLDEWRRFHAVLLDGVFFGIKHAARVMKAQNFGSIINTSSVAGIRACYGPHPYSSAKAAVAHLTRAAAMELARHFVRVNCICPGGIVTSIFATSANLSSNEAEASYDKLTEAFAQAQPIPRAGQPADIAGAALWLAGDDSSFVTGQVLAVDGGLTTGQSFDQVVSSWNQFRALMGVGPQGG